MVLHSSAIAGACAGLVSSVVTCPLDVVKTRLQAQEGRRRPSPPAPTIPTSNPPPPPNPTSLAHPPSASTPQQLRASASPSAPLPLPLPQPPTYLGLRATLRSIYINDGFRGFYRGLGPTIFGYLPTWAIYFTVYDNCKSLYPSSSSSEEFLNHILSAMTAGAASTICTSPLWVVKTRFMLQSPKDRGVKPYRHTGDAFVQIFRSEGLSGFYKGLLPSLFGVSHVAVQFPLYEWFKTIARDGRGGEGGGDGGELDASTILLCSSSAKMIASVTTYPHEVLRTRLQMQPRNQTPPSTMVQSTPTPTPTTRAQAGSTRSSQSLNKAAEAVVRKGRYTGVIQACHTIAREEGIRGFYKGMTVNLVRTVPSSALTILTYELIMQHLSSAHDDASD